MTTILLARRFAADVVRNGVTVFVLIAVPVVFVAAAAGMLAGVGRLLGGTADGPTMARLTAGWSAAFVAAVAMYYQVSAARGADRRLVAAGLHRTSLVTARLLTGATIAMVAAAVALLTLVVRTGAWQTWRAAAGTAMFAVVYLGLGALVGSRVRSPLNGTVLLLFIWILDVFFGPGLSASDSAGLRLLPTHYLALWVIEPAGSPDAVADLARGLAWLGAATTLAVLALLASSASGRRARARPIGALGQLRAGLRMAWHSWRRTPVLWVLLVVVPAIFIWLADATTPHGTTAVALRRAGRTVTETFDPADIHAGTMAPVAVAALAAMAGVLIGVDSHAADRRLALAGQRRWVVATTGVGTVCVASLAATGAALAVSGALFEAEQWPEFAGGNVLVAATYALLGLIAGPIVGRVSGTLLAFLVPFIDLGLGQSPMLHSSTPGWAEVLPGYGGTRLVIEGGLSESFEETQALLLGLAWLAALLALAVVGRRVRRSQRPVAGAAGATAASLEQEPAARPIASTP